MSVQPYRAAAWMLAALILPFAAQAATPAELLAAYSAKAGTPVDPAQGQQLFNTDFGRDLGLKCSSCHGPVPVKQGRDQVTEKPIAPLAPAANPQRFTDASKVEFWFRLNCRDVVGRECTAAEKANIISWLLTLKP
jgi:hypothetical protein